MPLIDMRVSLLAGAAIALLAISPAKAATDAAEFNDAPAIEFVSGTGDVATLPQTLPTPLPFADDRDDRNDVEDAQADLNRLSDRMADPHMQDNLAGAVERMTETMLDLPVGKFVAAIEKSVPGANKGRKRIRQGDTLADIAGRDADRLPEQLADGSRQMMGMMSGLASAFATMLPEFEKIGKSLEESMDDMQDAMPDGQ
jgi:hypothetical protein